MTTTERDAMRGTTTHRIDRERANRFNSLLIARCGAAANHGEGRIRFTDAPHAVTCKRCARLSPR